jgi:hypothetical protein
MPSRILLSWDDYVKHLGANHDSDYVVTLVEQTKNLIGSVSNDAVARLVSRLGGKITDQSLAALGKTKLEATINWLMTQQNSNNHVEA